MIPDAMEVLFFFFFSFFVTWNALGDQTASRKAVAAAALAMDVPGEYKGDDLIFTSSAVKKVGL